MLVVRPTVKLAHLISIVFIVILAGLSACGTQSTSGQSTIKIGVSLPNSGDNVSDGKLLEQGYDLWADMVNKNGGLLGRQVVLDKLHDNGTPEQVKTNYLNLIATRHDDLVLGSLSSPLITQEATAAKQYDYALIEGIGSTNKLFANHFPNLFAVSLPIKDYLTSFVDYILSLPASDANRPKSVAYIQADSPFAAQQIAAAKAKLGDSLKTYDEGVYGLENPNYATLAQKIVNDHPDVVILGTGSDEDCVDFIKAFKQQHFNPKAFIAASGPDQGKTFSDAIGLNATEGIFVPNGGWYPQIKTNGNSDFTSAYVAKYGGTVDDIASSTVQGYAAGQVLQQAVQKCNCVDNKKLVQTLHSSTFDTIQGAVKFDEDGQNTVSSAFLFQWQNGHLVAVYPSNQAQANPEYPRPARW